jgi:hypothetical protein
MKEQVNIKLLGDYLVLLDLISTNIKYHRIVNIFILKTIQNKFAMEDNFFSYFI